MSAMEILVKLVRERDLRSFKDTNPTSNAPPEMVYILWVPPEEMVCEGEVDESLRAKYCSQPEYPCILIRRLESRDNWYIPRPAVEIAAESTNPVDDLISLAHELGHHDSITRHHGSLSNSDPEETQYKEEVRAWILGRKILESEGFTDWAQFDLRMEEGLTSYQNRFSFSENDVEKIKVHAEEEVSRSVNRCSADSP